MNTRLVILFLLLVFSSSASNIHHRRNVQSSDEFPTLFYPGPDHKFVTMAPHEIPRSTIRNPFQGSSFSGRTGPLIPRLPVALSQPQWERFPDYDEARGGADSNVLESEEFDRLHTAFFSELAEHHRDHAFIPPNHPDHMEESPNKLSTTPSQIESEEVSSPQSVHIIYVRPGLDSKETHSLFDKNKHGFVDQPMEPDGAQAPFAHHPFPNRMSTMSFRQAPPENAVFVRPLSGDNRPKALRPYPPGQSLQALVSPPPPSQMVMYQQQQQYRPMTTPNYYPPSTTTPSYQTSTSTTTPKPTTTPTKPYMQPKPYQPIQRPTPPPYRPTTLAPPTSTGGYPQYRPQSVLIHQPNKYTTTTTHRPEYPTLGYNNNQLYSQNNYADSEEDLGYQQIAKTTPVPPTPSPRPVTYPTEEPAYPMNSIHQEPSYHPPPPVSSPVPYTVPHPQMHSYNMDTNYFTSEEQYGDVNGMPGLDYPMFDAIPPTRFSCQQQQFPGYYADDQARCQVFHVCFNQTQFSFLCPNGTVFDQRYLVCNWWFDVDCTRSREFFNVNVIFTSPELGRSDFAAQGSENVIRRKVLVTQEKTPTSSKPHVSTVPSRKGK